MSINYYKDLDGKIKSEDTILDDLSEMIRDETDDELDDDQVAEAAQKMLDDMVNDGSLKKVKPVKESTKPAMKSFNEFLIEALNESTDKFGFKPGEYMDWYVLSDKSKIVKSIKQSIVKIKRNAKYQAKKWWPFFGENADWPEKEGEKKGPYTWVECMGHKLDIKALSKWFENLSIDSFHGKLVLNREEEGLYDVLELFKTYSDDENLALFINDYYDVCIGTSEGGFESFLKNHNLLSDEK